MNLLIRICLLIFIALIDVEAFATVSQTSATDISNQLSNGEKKVQWTKHFEKGNYFKYTTDVVRAGDSLFVTVTYPWGDIIKYREHHSFRNLGFSEAEIDMYWNNPDQPYFNLYLNRAIVRCIINPDDPSNLKLFDDFELIPYGAKHRLIPIVDKPIHIVNYGNLPVYFKEEGTSYFYYPTPRGFLHIHKMLLGNKKTITRLTKNENDWKTEWNRQFDNIKELYLLSSGLPANTEQYENLEKILESERSTILSESENDSTRFRVFYFFDPANREARKLRKQKFPEIISMTKDKGEFILNDFPAFGKKWSGNLAIKLITNFRGYDKQTYHVDEKLTVLPKITQAVAFGYPDLRAVVADGGTINPESPKIYWEESRNPFEWFTHEDILDWNSKLEKKIAENEERQKQEEIKYREEIKRKQEEQERQRQQEIQNKKSKILEKYYKKYGKKWVDARLDGKILVGMPAKLLFETCDYKEFDIGAPWYYMVDLEVNINIDKGILEPTILNRLIKRGSVYRVKIENDFVTSVYLIGKSYQ